MQLGARRLAHWPPRKDDSIKRAAAFAHYAVLRTMAAAHLLQQSLCGLALVLLLAESPLQHPAQLRNVHLLRRPSDRDTRQARVPELLQTRGNERQSRIQRFETGNAIARATGLALGRRAAARGRSTAVHCSALRSQRRRSGRCDTCPAARLLPTTRNFQWDWHLHRKQAFEREQGEAVDDQEMEENINQGRLPHPRTKATTATARECTSGQPSPHIEYGCGCCSSSCSSRSRSVAVVAPPQQTGNPAPPRPRCA